PGALQQVDTCAAVTGANALMYQNAAAAQNSGDDGSRFGWNLRPYSWEFSLSGQHELTKGVSIYGGYFRRWFGNFLVTDDLNHTASDFERFGITPPGAPPASAGGATLPSTIYIDQFYVQKPGTVVGASNFVGLSDTFFPGSNVIDH